MTATARFVLDNATPDHGDRVTIAYVVEGNDGTPASSDDVEGLAHVGGLDINVKVNLTLPAVDPEPESFEPPVYPGLTIEATADPRVWTALIP